MANEHIIALLVAERDKLTRAIEALQSPLKRRGRPPKNPLAAIAAPSPALAPTKKRGGMTASARKAQSQRMKAYSAKRRKEA
jgi:hypothetical protein